MSSTVIKMHWTVYPTNAKHKKQGNQQVSHLLPCASLGSASQPLFLPSTTHSWPMLSPLCNSLYHPQLWFNNILDRNYRPEVSKLKLSHTSSMFCIFLLMLVRASETAKSCSRVFKSASLSFSAFLRTEEVSSTLSVLPSAAPSSSSHCSQWTSLTRVRDFAKPGLVAVRSHQDRWVRISTAQAYT